MNRFFLDPRLMNSPELNFPPDVSHQITRVLRLVPGDEVLALDGEGMEYRVRLLDVTPQACRGEILEKQPARGEPAQALHLYLSLTQREKFEWMLQKCTELGASAFIPVISRRSLVQDVREVEKKRTRWEQILKEAAEQSGRGRVPQLGSGRSLAQALEETRRRGDLALFAWEGSGGMSMRLALADVPARPALTVSLFIGPEGGYEPQETTLAKETGARLVTLGRRILRMETAAVAATALAMYELGEMEAPSEQTAGEKVAEPFLDDLPAPQITS